MSGDDDYAKVRKRFLGSATFATEGDELNALYDAIMADAVSSEQKIAQAASSTAPKRTASSTAPKRTASSALAAEQRALPAGAAASKRNAPSAEKSAAPKRPKPEETKSGSSRIQIPKLTEEERVRQLRYEKHQRETKEWTTASIVQYAETLNAAYLDRVEVRGRIMKLLCAAGVVQFDEDLCKYHFQFEMGFDDEMGWDEVVRYLAQESLRPWRGRVLRIAIRKYIARVVDVMRHADPHYFGARLAHAEYSKNSIGDAALVVDDMLKERWKQLVPVGLDPEYWTTRRIHHPDRVDAYKDDQESARLVFFLLIHQGEFSVNPRLRIPDRVFKTSELPPIFMTQSRYTQMVRPGEWVVVDTATGCRLGGNRRDAIPRYIIGLVDTVYDRKRAAASGKPSGECVSLELSLAGVPWLFVTREARLMTSPFQDNWITLACMNQPGHVPDTQCRVRFSSRCAPEWDFETALGWNHRTRDVDKLQYFAWDNERRQPVSDALCALMTDLEAPPPGPRPLDEDPPPLPVDNDGIIGDMDTN
jgi:hypothetical protein